jgi:AmiR/NasT family two-component response regulator
MGSITIPDPPCGTDACRELLRQLAAAIDHRDIIGAAKGMVMVTTDCSADQAFNLLKTESQHLNIKLWQVAERWIHDHERRVALAHS